MGKPPHCNEIGFGFSVTVILFGTVRRLPEDTTPMYLDRVNYLDVLG